MGIPKPRFTNRGPVLCIIGVPSYWAFPVTGRSHGLAAAPSPGQERPATGNAITLNGNVITLDFRKSRGGVGWGGHCFPIEDFNFIPQNPTAPVHIKICLAISPLVQWLWLHAPNAASMANASSWRPPRRCPNGRTRN